ncbi:MAG: histidine triad nucleotide-binding protein [Pontibacterium sp.]
MDCLFCKIVAGDIPATKVFEDDDVVAFNDISPAAPHHYLVIPKKHISTLNDLTPEDDAITGKMLRTAAQIAQDKGFAEAGYRTVFNCNQDGGQTVYHIHLHVLAGQTLGWPPFTDKAKPV